MLVITHRAQEASLADRIVTLPGPGERLASL